jgi:DNA-binding transcriptional regulator YiaG
MLGDGGQNVNGQSVCLGHIDGDEIDATLHEAGNEMHIAGKAIQSGNDERGFLTAAFRKGGGELGPVGMSLATLDLLELGEQGSAVRKPSDGGALGFQSKAAFALAFGRNPVISHKRSHLERLYFVETEVSESTVLPSRHKSMCMGEITSCHKVSIGVLLREKSKSVHWSPAMPIPTEVDVGKIRRGLKMTQANFCQTFGFSIDTLKHWEGKRRTPDSAARAYLTVIEHDPSAVMYALRIGLDERFSTSSNIEAKAAKGTQESIMKTVSAEDFKAALDVLGKPGGRQMDFLQVHADAPGRAKNAEGLAKAVNYENWRAINLHYGNLALDLGKILNRNEAGLELLCEFAEPGTLTNKEWILIMRPEFAEGLRLAGWIV